MSTRFDLHGRVALVTGASKGLGRHMAKTLAKAGAAVAVGARDLAAVRVLADEIAEEGGRAHAALLDVTSGDSVRAFVAEAEAALGPLSIAVNNAGVVEASPWHRMGEDEWDRVIATNLRGVWLMAQEAARCMKRHGGGGGGRAGSIINIASILGLAAEPGLPAYCASKAGVLNLTRAMALDLARHGIRVNAIAPGYFETDLNREYLASRDGQTMVQRIPLRRTGALEELDGPLLLLASEASRFMTGSVLVVDGGHSAAM